MVRTAASGSGFTVWLSGTPATSPSTIATLLATELGDRGLSVEVLDSDVAFSEDVDAKARRIGWGCELLNRNGIVAIAAASSPDGDVRMELEAGIARFVEVELGAPVDLSAERERTEASVARVVARLEELGYLTRRDGDAAAAYTADEESEVTDRLRDLGYL